MTNLDTVNNSLYEIAISIGNSLHLEETLRESLTTILHKLNGIAIAVVKTEHTLLYSIPKRKFHYVLPEHYATLSTQTRSVVWFYVHEQYYYYFRLLSGYLLIVKKTPLEDSVIKMLGGVCIKLDSSIQACESNAQRIQKERELAESLAHLEQTQAYKDRFLANMSHEIRTPLNAILGFVDQLHNSTLSDEQFNQVNIIKQSSETLLGVINDILDFSKIESGKIEIDRAVTNIKQTLNTSIALFKSRASEKNILLNYNYSDTIDTPVLADELRIKQVLNNLFSNAIKFTQAGGNITVNITTTAETTKNIELRFSVQDSGIGISDEQKEFIFNPFAQSDKSVYRKYGGTGLGLSISSQLVELMGGTLGFVSSFGEGSEFFFSLTLPKSPQPNINDQHTELVLNPTYLQNKRILIAEDNTVNQLLMKSIMDKTTAIFDIVENGNMAVEAYQNAYYDLILMDINMPIKNGVEAFNEINTLIADGSYPVPIVAVTANALAGDRENYINLGMSDCITKPIDIRQLYQVFKTLLS